jgi:hypothetical protein
VLLDPHDESVGVLVLVLLPDDDPDTVIVLVLVLLPDDDPDIVDVLELVLLPDDDPDTVDVFDFEGVEDDEILGDDENDSKLLNELITESDDNGVFDTLYESLGELDIDSDELSEYDNV